MDDNDSSSDDEQQPRMLPQTSGLDDLMRPRENETVEERDARHEALKSRVQVDLNDAKAIAANDLEDPILVRHMQARRDQLKEYSRQMDELVPLEKLIAADSATRRSFSEIVTATLEVQMNIRCALEDLVLQIQNVGKLIGGVQPHGFPQQNPPIKADDLLTQNLEHLVKRLGGVQAGVETVVEGLDEASRKLTVTRRECDTALTGYRQRCEAHQRCESGRADPK